MSHYDLVIKSGTIVDGTQFPRYVSDIGISDGRIEKIGPLGDYTAKREINAEGRIVAPGVIDLHTHYDAPVHWDPHCTASSWHGCTTVAVGNCGFGFSPCLPEDRERYMLMMENTEQVPYAAMSQALSWDWSTFPEWIEHMKRQPLGINFASYIPLNSMLIYVMGIDAAKTRLATDAERKQLEDMLHEAMDCGAIGFSLTHIGEANSHVDIDGTPLPTDSMPIENAYMLADILRERGEGCIQILCDSYPADNRHVAEELARRSGRPVIANLIIPFDMMPDFHTDRMKWLDDCEARGLPVYSQSLVCRIWNEFRVSDWNLWDAVALFREFSICDDKAKIAKASDPDYLSRLREGYDPEAMIASGGSLESFILHRSNGATDYVEFEGKLVGDIAKATERPVTDVFFEIIAQSELKADFRTTDVLSRDPVKNGEIARHKRCIPGTSDGGAHVKFFSGGHYSTEMIAWLVREEGILTLEEAHFRLSQLPARILGLDRRGTLEEGNAADLYIYDYDKIGYTLDDYTIRNDLPNGDWRRVVEAEGIDWVVVNGEPIFENNETCAGELPGQLVSNLGAEMDIRLSKAA
ncbi:MAG: amidohydrolase family protein [Pseudomonadota bacterium]